jgi:hypothetical protein
VLSVKCCLHFVRKRQTIRWRTFSKDGHWLLANSESGKLFVVDVASGALTKTFDTPDVPVLPTPGEFALAPDGMHAYLSCPQGGTIEILNLKDCKLEEPIRLTKGVDGTAWVQIQQLPARDNSRIVGNPEVILAPLGGGHLDV